MEKMRMESVDIAAQNVEKIAALFPNCVTEALDEKHSTPDHKVYKKVVNFDILRQMLSGEVLEGDEAYEFTWVGKKAAIVEANKPIRMTLRPCPEESVNWDNTENLYIEGDNLQVLKLLQESYLGKVKMIYIDPPYNTGNDFVYADDFRISSKEWDIETGAVDEFGKRLYRNTETNGRFHSDWCSMVYSRFLISRNMLTDDGIIFISIDDAEAASLKKIADEVFGEKNFVAALVYDKNRKNDARYFSVGHEYMLVYFKNAAVIYDSGLIYRAPKEGVEEVREEFEKLKNQYGNDWEKINAGLKRLYASWPIDDERRPMARFTKVDEKGPYRDDGNISWPGGGGPKYTVLHPVTGKPCKTPDAGWRFPSLKRMQEEIDNGRVVFGKDETTLPRIRRNLFEADSQVMRSVHFSYAQTATLDFIKIFDNKRVFENPKPLTDIHDLIRYVTMTKSDEIIMDFFSGSATTAHAVMQLNSEDGGKRKYILVQLPETCDEESEAYKAGFKNICEIGKERIRRAGKKIKKDNPLTSQDLDVGFRVFKLDDTNMKDVYYSADEITQQALFGMESNIKEDRTDLDLLFGCLLEWGLPLSLPYTSEQIEGYTVHTYNDGDLIACFDANVPDSVIKTIARRKPLRAVFRDSSFANSPAKINVAEIFKLLSPDTRVKVI